MPSAGFRCSGLLDRRHRFERGRGGSCVAGAGSGRGASPAPAGRIRPLAPASAPPPDRARQSPPGPAWGRRRCRQRLSWHEGGLRRDEDRLPRLQTLWIDLGVGRDQRIDRNPVRHGDIPERIVWLESSSSSPCRARMKVMRLQDYRESQRRWAPRQHARSKPGGSESRFTSNNT